MSNDLKAYKDSKKAKIVYKELCEASKNLAAAIEILRPQGHYIWIQECICVMHNSRTIIETNVRNYKKALKL